MSIEHTLAIERMRQHPGLLEWFHFGETGVSSRFIVDYLVHGHQPRPFDAPVDPADFRRCELLLRAVPTLRLEFHRMANVSPRWEHLVKKWDGILGLIDEEVPGVWDSSNGSAPRAYALMNVIR